jgi:hypothetical protein
MKNTLSTCLAVLICFICINKDAYSQNETAAVKEVRTIEKFDVLVVSGLPEVYLSEGHSDKIELEVSGMPIEDLIIRSIGGVLTIKTRGEHNGESVKVYVTCSGLRSIEVSGAAKVFSKHTIKTSNLDIHVRDAGEAEIDVDVNAVVIDLKDAGDLKITGKAHSRKVTSLGDQGTLNDGSLVVSIQ